MKLSVSNSRKRPCTKRKSAKLPVRFKFESVIRVLLACSFRYCLLERFADSGVFRQQKATTTGKATSAAADQEPLLVNLPRSSNPAEEHMGGNDAKLGSSIRSASAPGHSQGPEKGIDDIRDLSLEQTKSKEHNEVSISPNNPRKRGPDGESGSPDAPNRGLNKGPMSTRARHGKTLSGGRTADHTPQLIPSGDAEYKRQTSGLKQTLWDPNIDSTHNAKGLRRENLHSHSNPNRRRHLSKDPRSPEHGLILNENKSQSHAKTSHDPPAVQQALAGSDTQEKQELRPEEDEETHSGESSPKEDLMEDDHPESPDSDPEMLLQPETRPISHEQLVVEVKGIYAGLVMVEAKCIDIDERQSAAAQEKDLSKRPELKNDQWQSLIALHKQVCEPPWLYLYEGHQSS